MSPTSYRTAPPRVTEQNPNGSIATAARPRSLRVRIAIITAVLCLLITTTTRAQDRKPVNDRARAQQTSGTTGAQVSHAAARAQSAAAPAHSGIQSSRVVRTADPIERGLR